MEVVKYISGRIFAPKFNIRLDDATVSVTEKILRKENVSSQNKLVAIIPAARGRAKQWPVDNFKKLIDLISAGFKDVKVIILGSKETESLYRGLNVLDFSGKTTIKGLAALLKRCSLLVGLDTGPSHLGAALGIPTIMLFGGSDVNETSPVSKNALIIKKDFDCSPCRGRLRCRDVDCMKAIKPEEVFKEAEKWIK